MKIKIFALALFASFFTNQIYAQDRTTVNATSSEISDNLDLRAVASIFGDSEDLNDFERRLNDPKFQISNLDLNGDNEVDYLRVIESVQGYTHLIIIQAVLERDIFQDVATIEVEKDQYNRVQVQVVGDVYMYGNNYIYEPEYRYTPSIYASFWVNNYRPYRSTWYWGYYPSYYYVWNPYPAYRYRNNVNVYINVNNNYNYVNVRRSNAAVAMYSSRRSNDYEREYPNRSFSNRNASVSNRFELNQTRSVRNVGRNNEIGNSRGENRSQTRTSRGNLRGELTSPKGNSTRQNTISRGTTKTEATAPLRNSRSENRLQRSNNRTESVLPSGGSRNQRFPTNSIPQRSSSPSRNIGLPGGGGGLLGR